MLVIAGLLAIVLGSGGSKSGTSASAKPVAHLTSTVAPPATATSTSPAPATVTAATTQVSPTTATSPGTTSAADAVAQVARLQAVLELAGVGRRALARGDLAAAIANRRLVLRQLDRFQPDAELAASVVALKAAESFSLHADTTCGLNCSANIDQHSTDLKQAFLAIFNPIATQFGTRTYTAGEI